MMIDNVDLAVYFKNFKRIKREDLLELMDHALDKRDFEWCEEIHKRLQWLK